jgi:uncharacterized cupin superfamily protein
MVEQAPLVEVDSGLAPGSEGWFVVNAADAAWLRNDAFGARCIFEADPRTVRGLDGLEPHRFAGVGYALTVLAPGQPSGLYHRENQQEDFLVLAGACLAIVAGAERELRAWDFLHCPAGTEHAFVGAGDGPCVLLMVGERRGDREIAYPALPAAVRRGAAVADETRSARDAYSAFPHWTRGRPDSWAGLPWSNAR